MFDPRAPATAVARPSSPLRAGRSPARAALVILPWLLLGAACLEEDPAADDSNSEGGSDAVGQGPTSSAGTGGSSPLGTGGTTVVTTPAGGSGGSSTGTSSGGMTSVGGGGQAAAGGAGGVMEPFPAATGETGIFVGMTAAHNAARAELALSPPLPDLTWSEDLATFAQEWADNLTNDTNCGTIFHRTQRMYGENIGIQGTAGRFDEYAPEEAVQSWVAEVACWEYGTILGNRAPSAGSESCDSVCIEKQHSSGCGHYTQVIWRNTREVGCGYAMCNDGRFDFQTWVCNYNPPGNFVGQTPY